jgi:hypothetical protein
MMPHTENTECSLISPTERACRWRNPPATGEPKLKAFEHDSGFTPSSSEGNRIPQVVKEQTIIGGVIATPISIPGNRSCQFTSSYGLFAEMHPEGFISKLLSGQAGNRIVAASIDASTLISPCCTLPWFPGILLDSLLLFPITCYGIFQSFSSKTAACAAEGQSQYLFTLPRLLSAPGTNPFRISE